MSTIAAISTPLGKGGIAVIRISGENTMDILKSVFMPKSKKEITEYKPNTLVYGDIIKADRIIDNGMAVFFKAPHSYTGEDSAEIHCHGGVLISSLVLEAVFSAGAQPAQRGEFTQRAFISGKLGLTQAEAVIDLIDAESESKAVLAASQAKGMLTDKINNVYEEIMTVVSSIYAFIDYPDEDMTDMSVGEVKSHLINIEQELTKLEKSYHTGKAVCEGVKTVIIGKPNTGKSSLLNLMLGEERAIVTDIAGTTRDTLEETVVTGNAMLRLCDTAGIRQSDDKVESIGVERALTKFNEAELVLAVFDNSNELNDEDFEIIARLKSEKQKTIIILLNKSDISQKVDKEKFSDITPHILSISAKNGQGKDELFSLVEKIYTEGDINIESDAVITNARQFASVIEAKNHILTAIESLDSGFTQDVAGLELELAMSSLGNVDGRQVTDDIVGNIFSRFCVGK